MGSGSSNNRAQVFDIPNQQLYYAIVNLNQLRETQSASKNYNLQLEADVEHARARVRSLIGQIKMRLKTELNLPSLKTNMHDPAALSADLADKLSSIKRILEARTQHPVIEEWLRSIREKIHMMVTNNWVNPIAGMKKRLVNMKRNIPETIDEKSSSSSNDLNLARLKRRRYFL